MKRLLRALALLSLVTSGCLEGDPNPYDKEESSAGSGNTGGTGSAGSSATGGSVAAGVVRYTPGEQCSMSSAQNVSLTFHNRSQRAVQVFWVDYQCQEKLFSDLPVGRTYMISTYSTHPWRVRDPVTGAFLLEYVASGTPAQDVDIAP